MAILAHMDHISARKIDANEAHYIKFWTLLSVHVSLQRAQHPKTRTAHVQAGMLCIMRNSMSTTVAHGRLISNIQVSQVDLAVFVVDL